MIRARLLATFTAVLLLAPVTASAALYAIDESAGTLYQVDPSNAAVTAIGPTVEEPSWSALAYDCAAGIMYVSDITGPGPVEWGLGVVDLQSGEVTYVGDHVISNNIWGLAYDSTNDILYGANEEAFGLVTVDRTTGAATTVGGWGIEVFVLDLAYDASTETMFAITEGELYEVDLATGALTLIGGFGGPQDMSSLAFDPATGTLFGGAGSGNLYTIDASTGQVTLVGSTGIALDAIEFVSDAAALPADVPALGGQALALLALLLAGCGVLFLRFRG